MLRQERQGHGAEPVRLGEGLLGGAAMFLSWALPGRGGNAGAAGDAAFLGAVGMAGRLEGAGQQVQLVWVRRRRRIASPSSGLRGRRWCRLPGLRAEGLAGALALPAASVRQDFLGGAARLTCATRGR